MSHLLSVVIIVCFLIDIACLTSLIALRRTRGSNCIIVCSPSSPPSPPPMFLPTCHRCCHHGGLLLLSTLSLLSCCCLLSCLLVCHCHFCFRSKGLLLHYLSPPSPSNTATKSPPPQRQIVNHFYCRWNVVSSSHRHHHSQNLKHTSS